MYWDPSFESWRYFGVRVNSEAWIVSADGSLIGERFFGFDTDAILATLT
jgi:hypothetical protein